MKNPLSKLLLKTSFVLFLSLLLWVTPTLACQNHSDVDHEHTFSAFLAKTNAPFLGKQVQYSIPSISCMSCAYKIKKALKPITGVQEIKVDVDTHTLHFKCDHCDQDEVQNKLQEIGYPVSKST